MAFERVGSEVAYEGKIVKVRVDRFRYDDGEEADREIVAHPGAVGVVAHDGERLYLVRQPREAVNEKAVLEIPAGKLDEEGEGVLETAKRELREEIGKGAREWRHLKTYWSSVGFTSRFARMSSSETTAGQGGCRPARCLSPNQVSRTSS